MPTTKTAYFTGGFFTMTSIYKKGNRTCTITYKNGLMKIEYKTDGKTDIIISCNSSEKTEYDAIYFWDRVK